MGCVGWFVIRVCLATRTAISVETPED